jgi:hypothetical protein
MQSFIVTEKASNSSRLEARNDSNEGSFFPAAAGAVI